MWWVFLSTSHAGAWVLDAARPARLRRALKAAERAEITWWVGYSDRTACIEVASPSLRIRNRVARRLRGPVESREDCDWGWFPGGRGWVAVLIDPPADGLLPLLEALGWPYYDLQVPSEGPIRLCASEIVAGDPDELAEDLDEAGLVVRGVRRVGACRRDP